MKKQNINDGLHEQLKLFLADFDLFVKTNSIDIGGISIDHIGYKCGSHEEYEELRAALECNEKFIYQSIISKRRIAMIGFKEPLQSICGKVRYLELSDQKPDGSQTSNVDHLELLATETSYEDMLARFVAAGIPIVLNAKSHHTTHDICFGDAKKIKLSREKIIDKIYRDEMSAV